VNAHNLIHRRLPVASQAGQEPRISSPPTVVADGYAQRLLLPDEHEQPLAPRDPCVDEIAFAAACSAVSPAESLLPGTPIPATIATGHLLFDAVQAFQASFGQHAQEIMEDIPLKYTNSEPVVQVGEVKL
jgi:hypothetical protein